MVTTKSLFVTAAAVAVTAACSMKPASESATAQASSAGGRSAKNDWGVVLGHIPSQKFGGTIALDTSIDTIVCDLHALGFDAVRLEVQREESAQDYAPFVDRLRREGITSLVVRQPLAYTCGAATGACFDAWLSQSIDLVSSAAATLNADAFEIGNETNGQEFVPYDAFAILLTRTFAAVKANRPNAIVVAGGNLNVMEDYWAPLLDKLPAGSAPFDVFGVHPYLPAEYRGDTSFGVWTTTAQARITKLHDALAARFGSARLWATEVGFAIDGGPVNDQGQLDNVTRSAEVQARTVRPIDDGLAGYVERVFWYDYRDDETAQGAQGFDFGLRRSAAFHYATKPVYGVFAALLGGAGAGCYPGDAAPTPPPTPPTPPPTPPSPPTPPQTLPTCDQLASANGWTSPLCDQGGNVCEGIGQPAQGCSGGCCDVSQIHCGTVATILSWPAGTAACDNSTDGTGACAGKSDVHTTVDCTAGCCQF